MSFDWISDPEVWTSLFMLTTMEIVLGIDNLVFISILAGKLPEQQQARARKAGLALALITRILLLSVLAWIVKLEKPLFGVFGHDVSGKDLIMLVGGLFLLAKATHEIHDKLEGEDGSVTTRLAPSFASVLAQIMVLDIVFSLDSIITAVGMAKRLGVMVAAVVLAVIFMLLFVEAISNFVNRHPTIKMLALSFLLLIGCALIAEGCHKEIPKGYIYFAMAFSVGVECLNMRVRSKSSKVVLHQPYR